MFKRLDHTEEWRHRIVAKNVCLDLQMIDLQNNTGFEKKAIQVKKLDDVL